MRYTPAAFGAARIRGPTPPHRSGGGTDQESKPPMFDALSDRLRKTLGTLTGHGRVSAADVDIAMREVRLALLEADVNFKVVKDFVGRVRERASGARYWRA